MKTPHPNDSLIAFLSSPVGGLRSFRRNWQTNMLKCVKRSTIHHQSKISQSSPDSRPIKDLALASYIQSLLSKNIIERMENVKSLRFYNRLFIVLKPHHGWMLVTDLCSLNTFLFVERLKWKLQSPSGTL